MSAGVTEELLVTDKLNNLWTFHKFITFHRNQLESSGVPQKLWKVLHEKLSEQNFDAGASFDMALHVVEEEAADDLPKPVSVSNSDNASHSWKVLVRRQEGISPSDEDQIYLIDHAWTYRAQNAGEDLERIPGLTQRMASLMDIAAVRCTDEDLRERVLEEMWRFNQTYSFGAAFMKIEDTVPQWYIMDEFGSRIQHSDEPNFRAVPFYDMMSQCSYTLLFPIKYVTFQEEVTRNYLEGLPVDPLTHKAMKIPWEMTDMTDIDCNQVEPTEEFLRSGRVEESLPDPTIVVLPLPEDRKLKVYSEYSTISKHLTHPSFEVVANETDADILWYGFHFKEYRDLSISCPHKRISQFPFEHVITVKDLLAVVCRRGSAQECTMQEDTLETIPVWLPTTYNLKTELPKFVSYYQRRQKKCLDNYWICKPWNLARSLDTHITNNLNYILRLPSTGPKVACKYISDPVLFLRSGIGLVKFDFRYIILLCSVRPLKVYVYERFWLRFANKPFSLDKFEDYEKHFTVMNYGTSDLKQMFCHEFIKQFDVYYGCQWKDIEKDVFAVLKAVFQGATERGPPSGLCPNPQSRAMYAADMMLEWDRTVPDKPRMQPKLLEINWSPDCQRACQYYPEFFNDVFSVLFLDADENRHVVLL